MNKHSILAIFILFSVIAAHAQTENTDRTLAILLAEEGDYHAAAIEFRRLAMQEPEQAAGYGLASVHEYLQNEETRPVPFLLDQIEKSADSHARVTSLFYRAEQARLAKMPDEASFYYQLLLDEPDTPADYRNWAARQLAVIELRAKNTEQARTFLLRSEPPPESGLEALNAYRQGRDKRPMLGGALGLIPGLGYFYSGEYANGLRSIILNSLFIFGMVATAEEDQWGGFAVITFFEITWYSGSIYGGVDAAHRYNKRRMDACADAIAPPHIRYEMDTPALPLFSLRFEF
ncbi:MAG: hypothetical protein PHP44_13370 [Kiritimatiellae bacterium]|nr:hypothetical protein [Kiritimatiellia bacterium]MDD4737081.1 hypothetical protein [Kiritimatiellia bacterium]